MYSSLELAQQLYWDFKRARRRQVNRLADFEIAQTLQLSEALAALTLTGGIRFNEAKSLRRRYLQRLEQEVTDEEMARKMQQSLQDEGLAGRISEKWGFEEPFKASKLGHGNGEAEPDITKVGEDCQICYEDTPEMNMFTVRSCSHKVCVDCLARYVEFQVKENAVPVKCPLECSECVEFDQCAPFLSLEVVELFARRLTESTIPQADRVYCPFPNCSALMSKDLDMNLAMMGSSSTHPHPTSIGSCQCLECHRLFCVECKVPWHRGLSCADYQRLPPWERDAEDIELHELARNKNWQRCSKCQSMIELARGCYHMKCRCGFEFCYTCGAEWETKRPTCKCKLWDEHNLMNDSDSEKEIVQVREWVQAYEWQ